MVATIWLNAVGSMATTLGIDPAAFVYLLAFAFSFGITLAVALSLKKYEQNIALPTFFLMLLVMVFIGAFEWLFLVIPLILIGVYYLKNGGDK